jgi:hypothetical protein
LEKKFVMISCRVEEAEDIKGCAGKRAREGSRREGTGGLYHVGIGEGLRRYLRASTSNSVGLVASRARGRKGDGGGVLGQFIGVAGLETGRG